MSRSGPRGRVTGLSTKTIEKSAGFKPPNAETVVDELRRQYDKLTQSQKRIAEYIADHPDLVAFATVDQMAMELGVNPSTIVRFAYRLGLKGFPDLQERMRQVVRGQLSLASEMVAENSVLSHLEGTIFEKSLGHDLQNIRRTIASLRAEDLARAVELLLAPPPLLVAARLAPYTLP